MRYTNRHIDTDIMTSEIHDQFYWTTTTIQKHVTL